MLLSADHLDNANANLLAGEGRGMLPSWQSWLSQMVGSVGFEKTVAILN